MILKRVALLLALAGMGYYFYQRYGSKREQAEVSNTAAIPAPPPALEMPAPQVLDEDQIERVRTSVNDSDPKVRWEAVQLLINAKDPQADQILYAMLRRDDDANIRRDVIRILSTREGEQVSLHLQEALHDTEADVRLAALEALGKRGDSSSAPAISDALHDTDERVRLNALKVLNELQIRRNLDILEKQRRHEELLRQQEAEAAKKKPR
ncbi:MAG: HEAT repeat domain-containing protein [Elusimicrobiota bacterium]|jgi:HEAT repeat protein